MFRLTIKELQEKLTKQEITSIELVKTFLERIKKIDDKIGAYLSIMEARALKQAQEIDKTANIQSGLTGIPFANKALISIKGEECNAGSKILKNFKPIKNATVIDKLDKSGAICLGNTNMDEFAQGSSTENSGIQITKNPWDTKKVPGGSSGGAAAAVAADECVFALGTDTGGSVRQPAAFCGCVGLKVTYGRVSRSGVMAYGSSFDSVGAITKSVEDAALVLENIAGNDLQDFTTPKIAVPQYSANLESSLKGKKIAYIKEFMNNAALDPKIRTSIENLITALKKEGVLFEEISIPELDYAVACYYLLVKSEGSTNLHRYDGIRYGQATNQAKSIDDVYNFSRSEALGDEVKRCIMLGTYTLSAGYYDAYYLKAAKVRRLIKESFDQVFAKYNAVLAPVSPFLPFDIGEKSSDPLAMYLADVYTVSANLAGIPGVSLPIGVIDNLPTGVQILTKQFNEKELLEISYMIEKMVSFTRLKY